MVAYADASAIVKLILDEAESAAMYRWYVELERVATSRVGVVETVRAAMRRPHDETRRDRVLGGLEVIDLSRPIARRAETVGQATLRTLDAIHLASALALGLDLEAFVTYDDRLAAAARQLGLPVVRPA